MNIMLTTESGSRYIIRQQGEDIYISKVAAFEGKIVRFDPIRIGRNFTADIKSFGIYGNLQQETSWLKTTKVTDIQVFE